MENNGRAHTTGVGAVQGYGEEENLHVRDRAGPFKHFFRKKRAGLIQQFSTWVIKWEP